MIAQQTREEYDALPGVNASLLCHLAQTSPAHLKAKMDGLLAEKTTESMNLGTLFHSWLLEPETVEGSFHIRPEGMSFASKEGRAWRAEHTDKPIVDAEDIADTKGMVEAVNARIDLRPHFQGAQAEVTLAANDSGGIQRKGRLDLFHAKSEILIDFKRSICAKPYLWMTKAIKDFHYHLRAAWYVDLCRLCGVKKSEVWFVAVEPKPPYYVGIFKFSDDDGTFLRKGRAEYRALLSKLMECQREGIWPGYEPDTIEAESAAAGWLLREYGLGD